MEEEQEEQSLDSRDVQVKALRSGSTRLRIEALKKIQQQVETFGERPMT